MTALWAVAALGERAVAVAALLGCGGTAGPRCGDGAVRVERAVSPLRGFMVIVVADVSGEGVEGITLRAGDLAVVVVMGPWGDEKQTALGTGLKLTATGLLIGGEAVFNQDDDGVASLKGSSHHLFLSRADARGDKYHTLTGHVKKTMALGFYLLF